MIQARSQKGLRDIARELGHGRIINVMGTRGLPRAIQGVSRRCFRIDFQKRIIDQAAAQAESEGLASCAADAERLQIDPAPGTPPAHRSPIISGGNVATLIFKFVRQFRSRILPLFLCFFAFSVIVRQRDASILAPLAQACAQGELIFASRRCAIREQFASTSRTSFYNRKRFSRNAKEAYGKGRRAGGEHFASTSRAVSEAPIYE